MLRQSRDCSDKKGLAFGVRKRERDREREMYVSRILWPYKNRIKRRALRLPCKNLINSNLILMPETSFIRTVSSLVCSRNNPFRKGRNFLLLEEIVGLVKSKRTIQKTWFHKRMNCRIATSGHIKKLRKKELTYRNFEFFKVRRVSDQMKKN